MLYEFLCELYEYMENSYMYMQWHIHIPNPGQRVTVFSLRDGTSQKTIVFLINGRGAGVLIECLLPFAIPSCCLELGRNA